MIFKYALNYKFYDYDDHDTIVLSSGLGRGINLGDADDIASAVRSFESDLRDYVSRSRTKAARE